MNPPIVYDVTKPRSQRTSKMTAMVQSIFHHLPYCSHGNPSRQPSVSASVRNASRRLSDSRIGVCPRAGRGAGGFEGQLLFLPLKRLLFERGLRSSNHNRNRSEQRLRETLFHPEKASCLRGGTAPFRAVHFDARNDFARTSSGRSQSAWLHRDMS